MVAAECTAASGYDQLRTLVGASRRGGIAASERRRKPRGDRPAAGVGKGARREASDVVLVEHAPARCDATTDDGGAWCGSALTAQPR